MATYQGKWLQSRAAGATSMAERNYKIMNNLSMAVSIRTKEPFAKKLQ